MAKVNDFCIVPELGVLLTISTDKFIRVFRLEVNQEGATAADFGQVQLFSTSSFTKESSQRGLQCEYDKKRNLLYVLSADN